MENKNIIFVSVQKTIDLWKISRNTYIIYT